MKKNLIVRLKTGSGRKTYVWYIPEDGDYYIQWHYKDGTCYADQYADANEAACLMFEELWDGSRLEPVKFFIRRAKAGIAIIDHAKAHGL